MWERRSIIYLHEELAGWHALEPIALLFYRILYPTPSSLHFVCSCLHCDFMHSLGASVSLSSGSTLLLAEREITREVVTFRNRVGFCTSTGVRLLTDHSRLSGTVFAKVIVAGHGDVAVAGATSLARRSALPHEEIPGEIFHVGGRGWGCGPLREGWRWS